MTSYPTECGIYDVLESLIMFLGKAKAKLLEDWKSVKWSYYFLRGRNIF